MSFYENLVVLNPGKCHNLIINKDIAIESSTLGRKTLHAEAEQKLFGIMMIKFYISLRSFSSHNERSFYKKNPEVQPSKLQSNSFTKV